MSPLVAARISELRETLDATLTVLSDDGNAAIVFVAPTDLPPFVMLIDPARLHFSDSLPHGIH